MAAANERSVVRKVAWRLLPVQHLIYTIAAIDRTNVGFAALQMNKALGFSSGVFCWCRHIFHRLRAVRSTEQLDPDTDRCAQMDCSHHDHLGPDRDRHGVDQRRIFILPSSLPTRRCRSRFSSWHDLLLATLDTARGAGEVLAIFLFGPILGSIVGGPLGGALLSLDGWLGFAGWQLPFYP